MLTRYMVIASALLWLATDMISAIATCSHFIDLIRFITVPEDKFKPLNNMVTFCGTSDLSIVCVVIAFSAADGEF